MAPGFDFDECAPNAPDCCLCTRVVKAVALRIARYFRPILARGSLANAVGIPIGLSTRNSIIGHVDNNFTNVKRAEHPLILFRTDDGVLNRRVHKTTDVSVAFDEGEIHTRT